MDPSVEDTLARLGLSQYVDRFRKAGFNTPRSFCSVSERDFEILGVKLGHRRRLQRDRFCQRGGGFNQPLPSIRATCPAETLPATRSKRRYRRHPRVDVNAPKKPPSAYIAFANFTRCSVDVKGRSFEALAKDIGHKWQILPLRERAVWSSVAAVKKALYHDALEKYKQTEAYRHHEEYLEQFERSKQDAKLGLNLPK